MYIYINSKIGLEVELAKNLISNFFYWTTVETAKNGHGSNDSTADLIRFLKHLDIYSIALLIFR